MDTHRDKDVVKKGKRRTIQKQNDKTKARKHKTDARHRQSQEHRLNARINRIIIIIIIYYVSYIYIFSKNYISFS